MEGKAIWLSRYTSSLALEVEGEAISLSLCTSLALELLCATFTLSSFSNYIAKSIIKSLTSYMLRGTVNSEANPLSWCYCASIASKVDVLV